MGGKKHCVTGAIRDSINCACAIIGTCGRSGNAAAINVILMQRKKLGQRFKPVCDCDCNCDCDSSVCVASDPCPATYFDSSISLLISDLCNFVGLVRE
jgi:hypothetical protein